MSNMVIFNIVYSKARDCKVYMNLKRKALLRRKMKILL